MKLILFFFFFLSLSISIFAQKHTEQFESVDIQHYIFEIHLNDTTNYIEGKTFISAKFLKPSKTIQLDFVGINDSTATGMIISDIFIEGKPVAFIHKNDQLQIISENYWNKNDEVTFEVNYAGIPGDGLVISKNKYGNRTFFGDNWPNRARFWLPTIDHPSDKATLEFKVYSPEYYSVISNGFLEEENLLKNGYKYSHWKENIPISTKLMVIGVARFDVLENGSYDGIPVSSWVFPQNKEEGFRDFSDAIKPLRYFSESIGTYSYEKLAHVQSKTRYGGMENAGCIFYAEKAITGKKQMERLIAHETAHQWFGNSVTEQNWHHIWLSEGFATYLTHLYNLNFYGEKMFREGLKNDRERVIKFAEKKLAPIIDTTITDYNRLLNTNSYQKASWFLHMLREKIGEPAFQKCLQNYYSNFKDSTALTSDFQKIAEENSGIQLNSFFHQWLYEPGFPVLKVKWKQKKNNRLELKINQFQKNYSFSFPLEIAIHFNNGESRIETIQISENNSKTIFQFQNKVKSIELDPNVKLLFTEFTK